MPSAESNSVKTIFRVDYQPTLDFYDRIYSIGQTLSSAYPNWETDRLKVVLKDFKSKCSLLISHANAAFTQDLPNSSAHETSRIEEAIKVLPPALGKSLNTRVGLRRKYLIPVEMDYSDLRQLVSSKLLSPSAELAKGISSWSQDFHVVFAAPKNTGFIGLTLGPISHEQLPTFLEPSESNFQPGDVNFLTGKWLDGYPKAAIYVDCDYVKTSIRSDKLLDFYAEARENHKTLVDNVQHYLLGID